VVYVILLFQTVQVKYFLQIILLPELSSFRLLAQNNQTAIVPGERQNIQSQVKKTFKGQPPLRTDGKDKLTGQGL
jgi:hypothetical protein